jgi:hypothetical protein
MAGNKMKNQNKRKPNPNTVRHTRVPRPIVNFNGQNLNGSGYFPPFTTLVNTAAAIYSLDTSTLASSGPANLYFQSINYDLNAISKVYNEFVYHSIRMEWVPFVAPGVADGGGQLYVCYVDNVEEIANIMATTSPNVVFDVAKNARNAKFFNAWERFIYDVPVSRRKKLFDTNSTSLQTIDVIDRSCQGAVISGGYSLSASSSLGQWRTTYMLELRNLNTKIVT